MLFTVALHLLFDVTQACTAIGVTPGASIDGSVFVGHSSDAEGAGDPRLYRVPGSTFTPGSMRAIFAQNLGIVEKMTAPSLLGHIPQPERTYSYFREEYGAMNEKQVILGETTTSSIAPVDGWSKPRHQGGHALFGIQVLTHIALERCDSARCAVKTMGELAEAHGFYQDAGTPTGEAIVAGDTTEVWVFHVLPDPTGKSAVWAAARVPDGQVVVVANMFVIRGMDLSQPDLYMGSSNLMAVAKQLGWREDDHPFDFTRIFSDPANGGEYGGRFYSGRRFWRAYSLLAPASTFSPLYDNLAIDAPYPFSVATTGVTVQLVMRVYRDFLQGTPFDLTVGLAAGPWGSPHRFAFPAESFPRWERPISIFRCTASYIGQARAWIADEAAGTLWFGPHVPHGTFYVPFAVGMPVLPAAYTDFNMLAVDRSSAYWAHAAVQSLAEARFALIAHEVSAMQAAMQDVFLSVQAKADELFSRTKDVEAMAAEYMANAERVASLSWRFFDALLFRYADGFVRANIKGPTATTSEASVFEPVGIGFPKHWLDDINYSENDGNAPPGGGLKHKPAPAVTQVVPSDIEPLAESLLAMKSASVGGIAAFDAGTGRGVSSTPQLAARRGDGSGLASLVSTRPVLSSADESQQDVNSMQAHTSLSLLALSLVVGIIVGAGLTVMLINALASPDSDNLKWFSSRWFGPLTPADMKQDASLASADVYLPFSAHTHN